MLIVTEASVDTLISDQTDADFCNSAGVEDADGSLCCILTHWTLEDFNEILNTVKSLI